jgi:hypothetical protein
MVLPPVGPTVTVSLDGKSAVVTLANVRAAEGASGFVALAEVWKAAFPSEDYASLKFDFVGSDGFRPTSRPKCTRLLSGSELGAARLEVTTHHLAFEESSKLPGCYRVRALVAIEATR